MNIFLFSKELDPILTYISCVSVSLGLFLLEYWEKKEVPSV